MTLLKACLRKCQQRKATWLVSDLPLLHVITCDYNGVTEATMYMLDAEHECCTSAGLRRCLWML